MLHSILFMMLFKRIIFNKNDCELNLGLPKRYYLLQQEFTIRVYLPFGGQFVVMAKSTTYIISIVVNSKILWNF